MCKALYLATCPIFQTRYSKIETLELITIRELPMRTRKRVVAKILVLAGLLFARSTFATTDQDIAIQFFPDSLKAHILKEAHGKPVDLNKYAVCVRADLDGQGTTNYLVCVYSDRDHGALRVINTSGANPALSADASNVDLYGVEGGPSLIDLDNDKKPEIVVQFMSDRGNTSTWIFKWTGLFASSCSMPLRQTDCRLWTG